MTDPLVETWEINARINRFFLEEVAETSLWMKPSKGRPVGGQFAHIHNVRLMWLKSAAPSLLEGLSKLEDGATKIEIGDALAASAMAISECLKEGLEVGKIKGFKPHPPAFLGYLIAHVAHHRGQAELILRMLGTPISDKTSYGLWEWGVR
ncbi:MAG: hypothetical protein KF812_10600 [Fimbriimonadaceae bacterium]|nr:hypothetical protein [Fimbriimonadaceae bacterium]